MCLTRGSRNTRAVSTLERLGPAVLNGGASTLIAVIMLSDSKSHVFVSYFKVGGKMCKIKFANRKAISLLVGVYGDKKLLMRVFNLCRMCASASLFNQYDFWWFGNESTNLWHAN